MYIHLPDPKPSLADDARYAIRLANTWSDGTDVWNDSSGYNSLNHLLTIDNSSITSACTGQISFTTDAILSTSNPDKSYDTETFLEKGIQVFPNPSSGWIHIQFDQGVQQHIEQVAIYQIDGRHVQSYAAKSAALNRIELKSGIYFLVFTSFDGRTIQKMIGVN